MEVVFSHAGDDEAALPGGSSPSRWRRGRSSATCRVITVTRRDAFANGQAVRTCQTAPRTRPPARRTSSRALLKSKTKKASASSRSSFFAGFKRASGWSRFVRRRLRRVQRDVGGAADPELVGRRRSAKAAGNLDLRPNARTKPTIPRHVVLEAPAKNDLRREEARRLLRLRLEQRHLGRHGTNSPAAIAVISTALAPCARRASAPVLVHLQNSHTTRPCGTGSGDAVVLVREAARAALAAPPSSGHRPEPCEHTTSISAGSLSRMSIVTRLPWSTCFCLRSPPPVVRAAERRAHRVVLCGGRRGARPR